MKRTHGLESRQSCLEGTSPWAGGGGRIHGRGSLEGFTLIELMVALALAAMISVSIMFISSQAREAYNGTMNKVDVYNRFRFAFHSIEKDLKNWTVTRDLEFYTDGRGKGARLNHHWDPQEELPDRQDEDGWGVVDGGVRGEFDEYPYILERHYVSRERLQTEDKVHDAYQVYFRTMTFIDGATRAANVEYMLLDPLHAENMGGEVQAKASDPKLALGKIFPPPETVRPENVQELSLFKIIRYYDVSYKALQNVNETPIKRRVIEVCSNVTDFRVEYLADRGFNSRVEPEFKTPEEDFKAPVEEVTRPRRIPNLGPMDGYKKIFGYGSVKLNEKVELATVYPSRRGDDNLLGTPDHKPVRFGFQGSQRISFSELIPGDKVFVFTPENKGEAAVGVAGQSADNAAKLARFPSGDYTVKTNLSGLLEFEEDFDTTDWGGKPQTGVYYKAGFAPSAVRITMRVVDDKGLNPKTMQREVWIRRRSR